MDIYRCYRSAQSHQPKHYNDVTMTAMSSQITGVSSVCWTVGSGVDKRKHQSSTSLAFALGIHRWPVNSPHKRSVTRKMFPFDDVSINKDDNAQFLHTKSGLRWAYYANINFHHTLNFMGISLKCCHPTSNTDIAIKFAHGTASDPPPN